MHTCRPLQLRVPPLTKGKVYQFQLTHMRVLHGDELYSQILANVQPYRPNFLLHGPDAEVGKLDAVRSGEHVEIIGAIHEGGRDMLVTSIELRPQGAANVPTPEGLRW